MKAQLATHTNAGFASSCQCLLEKQGETWRQLRTSLETSLGICQVQTYKV